MRVEEEEAHCDQLLQEILQSIHTLSNAFVVALPGEDMYQWLIGTNQEVNMWMLPSSPSC